MARRPFRAAAALALAAVALAVAGCGSSGGDGAPGGDGVRAVGIDPGDHAVLAATRDGLLRLRAGQEGAAQPVGRTRDDLEGLAVTGAGRYLASGRRGRDGESLGLVATADGGRSWRTVSLAGQVDMHPLAASGRVVAGVDSASGQLMVSDDGGLRWRRLSPPSPLTDLAVDPAFPPRMIGVTASAMAVTTDGGRTWTALREGGPGLLAWPRQDVLWWVDKDGAVSRSADAGVSWTGAGDVDGPPLAIAAEGTARAVVARDDGVLLETTDGGATWRERGTVPTD